MSFAKRLAKAAFPRPVAALEMINWDARANAWPTAGFDQIAVRIEP